MFWKDYHRNAKELRRTFVAAHKTIRRDPELRDLLRFNDMKLLEVIRNVEAEQHLSWYEKILSAKLGASVVHSAPVPLHSSELVGIPFRYRRSRNGRVGVDRGLGLAEGADAFAHALVSDAGRKHEVHHVHEVLSNSVDLGNPSAVLMEEARASHADIRSNFRTLVALLDAVQKGRTLSPSEKKQFVRAYLGLASLAGDILFLRGARAFAYLALPVSALHKDNITDTDFVVGRLYWGRRYRSKHKWFGDAHLLAMALMVVPRELKLLTRYFRNHAEI